jgi:prepilin-type N-terminal cleavage/methylation domain-containing protein
MSKSTAFINSRRQAGFTMVELAIVLVIAGIILVGALKGTDMINKAKIERVTADLSLTRSQRMPFGTTSLQTSIRWIPIPTPTGVRRPMRRKLTLIGFGLIFARPTSSILLERMST